MVDGTVELRPDFISRHRTFAADCAVSPTIAGMQKGPWKNHEFCTVSLKM
jgi:hypothetical protein